MEPPDASHEDMWQLLPWYVNGTLEAQELEAVSAHLSACHACREEEARCRDLAVAVQAMPEADWSPSPERLAQVVARVEALETAASGGWRRWLRGRADILRETLGSSPVSMRWTLAAQGALVALLAAAVIWQAVLLSSQTYRTLATGSDQPAQAGAQFRVVFADDVTEREIRGLLTGINGSMVGGPSPAGAYTVAAPATTSDQVLTLLDVLRAHPKVRLAEPIVRR